MKLAKLKSEIKNKEVVLKEKKAFWEGNPYCTGPNIKPTIDRGYGGNVLVFNDEFHCENITRLINAIEKVKQNEYDELTLYFDSVGGVVADMLNLVDYINNLEDLTINIVSNGYLYSAGFYLFFLLDFTKPNLNGDIHDVCQCGTHKSTCREDTRDMSKELLPDFTVDTYFTKKKFIDNWLDEKIISKIGFSEEQLKWFRDGHEIYMSGAEMKEHLKFFYDNKLDELEQEHALEVLAEAEELKNKGYSLEEVGEDEYEAGC